MQRTNKSKRKDLVCIHEKPRMTTTSQSFAEEGNEERCRGEKREQEKRRFAYTKLMT